MQRIKENRSLLLYLVFSVLTLGIYAIWHQYALVRDINVMLKADGKQTPQIWWYALLGLLTLTVYPLVWYYRLGKRLQRGLLGCGASASVSGGGLLLLHFVSRHIPLLGFALQYKLIHATNDLAECYNRFLRERSCY